MSGYYDDHDAPSRTRSHKSRRPVYEEEEIYERGPSGRAHREVVRRRDSDSTEEIEREFPPPGRDGTYVKRKTTRRDKYAPRARSEDRHDRRDRRRRYDYSSDSYDSESSVSPPPRRRPKNPDRKMSLGEQALAALGIGGAAAAAGGGRDRHGGRDRDRDGYDDRKTRSYSRTRGRRDYSSDSRSRSRSKSVDARKKWQQAAKAAGTAAVLEAWKSRKEPGGIAGSGKRIMTAAIGAAGVDSAMDRNPDEHSKRHVLTSAIGGLASNRLVNGRSRSRSRSRARRGKDNSGPGLGGIASAASLAAVAAKGIKNYREKSRDRERSRDRGGRRGRRDSYSSSSSASPPPRRSRSKSIGRFIDKGMAVGMAKLGLADDKDSHHKSSRRHYSDDDEYYRPRPRGGELSRQDRKKIQHGSDTDSYSSSEEERKVKKMRGKEFITAGLATVATIHAGHSVYQSMEKRKQRLKKVQDGEMTPDEAKKLRNRARLQDAASVGIAALGIRGAVSEWKEVKESAHECKEQRHRFEEKRAHRRAKMLEAAKSNNSEPDLRGRYLQGVSASSVSGGGGDGSSRR